MSRKGQSAIEFMILIGAVFLFFIIFLVSLQINIADKAEEKRDIALKEVALTVQDEISLASESSDGYSRKFVLPNTALNSEYTVQIIGNMVYAKTLDEKHALAFSVLNVTGQLQIGLNYIKKENGKVYLNS